MSLIKDVKQVDTVNLATANITTELAQSYASSGAKYLHYSYSYSYY